MDNGRLAKLTLQSDAGKAQDAAMPLPHLLALLLWMLEMNPQFPMPHEVTDALKAITVTADKWGHVADQFTSGAIWAALVIGLIIGAIAVRLWTVKS